MVAGNIDTFFLSGLPGTPGETLPGERFRVVVTDFKKDTVERPKVRFFFGLKTAICRCGIKKMRSVDASADTPDAVARKRPPVDAFEQGGDR